MTVQLQYVTNPAVLDNQDDPVATLNATIRLINNQGETIVNETNTVGPGNYIKQNAFDLSGLQKFIQDPGKAISEAATEAVSGDTFKGKKQQAYVNVTNFFFESLKHNSLNAK